MSSRRLSWLKAVEHESTQCIPNVGHRKSPGAHMPVKSKLKRVAVMKAPTVVPTLVNMTATWEPECRKQTP